MQNIIKTNGISNLAVSLKSFRQRLNLVATKIVETKKSASAKVEVAAKPQEVKAEPAVAPVAKPAEKPQERVAAQPAARTNPANGQNGYQNRQNMYF